MTAEYLLILIDRLDDERKQFLLVRLFFTEKIRREENDLFSPFRSVERRRNKKKTKLRNPVKLLKLQLQSFEMTHQTAQNVSALNFV